MPWIYFGFNLYVNNGHSTERIQLITLEPKCKTVEMKKNSIKSNELDLSLFVCMKVIRSDLKTDKKLKIPTELRTTTSHFDYSMTSNVFWILAKKPVNLHSKLHVFSYRILTFNLSFSIKIQTRFDLNYTRIWPVFDLYLTLIGDDLVETRFLIVNLSKLIIFDHVQLAYFLVVLGCGFIFGIKCSIWIRNEMLF